MSIFEDPSHSSSQIFSQRGCAVDYQKMFGRSKYNMMENLPSPHEGRFSTMPKNNSKPK